MIAAPWPPGTATGVGSLGGKDPLAAARLVFESAPLPFLPELPTRGPGADLLGRTAGLLADLHVDLQPSGWRLVPRPGRDVRHARDLLQRDLDALELAGAGWQGPLKLQACGPWTLAVGLEVTRGGQALGDRGAVHDLSESLAEGLREHVAEVRRRMPGVTDIYLQLDEPSLTAVVLGRLRSASGFATLRIPETPELTSVLRTVLLDAPGLVAGVHCCADRVPLRLLTSAGVRFVSLDLTSLAEGGFDEELGEAFEAGVGIVAGLLPATGPLPAVAAAVAPLRALWRRLGFGTDDLGRVAVSPACGLPDRSLEEAIVALTRAREAAQELAGG